MIDAETKIRAWLATEFPSPDRVVTEFPATITGRIARVTGGPGSNVKQLQRVLVDVDCLASDRAAAAGFAEEVRDAFEALAHTTVDGVAYTLVETTMRPRWLPWDNTNVRRFGATYQIHFA